MVKSGHLLFYRRESTRFDKSTVRRQRLISKAASPVLQVLDQLQNLSSTDCLSKSDLSEIKNKLLDSVLVLSNINTYEIDARKRQSLKALGPRFLKYSQNLPGAKRKFHDSQESETLAGREGEFLFDSKACDIMKKDLKIEKKSQAKRDEARSRGNSHSISRQAPYQPKKFSPSPSYQSLQSQGGNNRGRSQNRGSRGNRYPSNPRSHR